jgi:hypothetical protein
MEQLFEAILKIADANPDGFTVDLTTLKKVTKGISVAYLEILLSAKTQKGINIPPEAL